MIPLIKGANGCASLRIELAQGESIKTALNTLIAMSAGLQTSSRADGGILRAIARKFSGNGFLFNEVTAPAGSGWLMLAPASLGAVTPIELHSKTLIAAEDAFLAAASNVEISDKSPVIGKDIASLKLTGKGTVFLNGSGTSEMFILPAGQIVIVKPSHLLAYEETITLETLTDGMIKVTGPGRLWIQTRTRQSFGQWLGVLPLSSK